MPNDNAITRLLYAILSQKCLKDIDWNKVAHDPILSQEITNGHAARMRYSRFKKQMDGTTGIVNKQKNPRPRKSKVEKNKAVKKEKGKKSREEEDDAEKVKQEREDTVESEGGVELKREMEMVVKSEPSERESSVMPSPFTPHSQTYSNSQNSTPSPSQSHHGFGPFGAGMGDMDEMLVSFGAPSMTGEVYPMLDHGFGGGMGVGMNIGMGDPYEPSLWHHHSHEQQAAHAGMHRRDQTIGDDVVKTEPRWEEAYRRV
ncbi:hypothetical protein G7Y89_g12702 [Cudoniella acicularis]|uniref:Myb-like DNA-binding domain-containing protein n=1 Tax=Cudoniella acicularis TaxID=354080 RepID=A0A8H4RB11_9HELO|nr:hypothetical protein G7Y89_g12702 [Cudoniella acicularis]